MGNWDKFDKAIDVKGLQEDVKEAKENGSNFKDVPFGDYEVELNKLELKESSKGDPMVTVWFKIIEGEYKGSLIFMNQVITKGFQIHIMNEMLRSLAPDMVIEFESYNQYGQLLLDIHEEVDGNLEYSLSYSEGKKGFATYEINEVFEVE